MRWTFPKRNQCFAQNQCANLTQKLTTVDVWIDKVVLFVSLKGSQTAGVVIPPHFLISYISKWNSKIELYVWYNQQFISQDLSRNKKPASLGDVPWDGKWPFTEGQRVDALESGKSPGKQREIRSPLLMDSGQGTVTIRATPTCMVNAISWVSWTTRRRESGVFQRR